MFRLTIIALVFFVSATVFGQEIIFYSGNNKTVYESGLPYNFTIKSSNNTSVLVSYNWNQGQVLVNQSNGQEFVLAKDLTISINANDSVQTNFYAYSIYNAPLPDSATVFSVSDRVNNELLPLLKEFDLQMINGNKAQIKIWNTYNASKLNEQLKYIHTFNKKIVYESSKTDVITVITLTEGQTLDTLIRNKTVGAGIFQLTLAKNVLSYLNTFPSYQIINDKGFILFDSQDMSAVATKWMFNYNYVFSLTKDTEVSLIAYDAKGNVVSTVFKEQKFKKGKQEQLCVFDYIGLATDTLHLKLVNAKGNTLSEKWITHKANGNSLSQGLDNYKSMDIKHKFNCKKNELRAKAILENDKGELLETIFEGKNIHSGINKVDYTFNHQLKPGDRFYLIVKLPSGKLIEKKEYTIFE